MTLRHIKIFVAVYQEHSVTKAADRLHLAQPSVSLAVRELEDFYHVRLFDRISRHIYPTEIGHKFYDYALHIVSLFSEMENGIPSWENKAPIHIGSSITLGNRVLPSLVKSYRAAHPDIPVRVTIKNTETIEQYVLNNKVDFALVEGGTSHTEFTAEPFYSDRLCFIASLLRCRMFPWKRSPNMTFYCGNRAAREEKSPTVSFFQKASLFPLPGRASAHRRFCAPLKICSASQSYPAFSFRKSFPQELWQKFLFPMPNCHEPSI